jgi:hypothetical protein
MSLHELLLMFGLVCSNVAFVCAVLLFRQGHRLRGIAIGTWNVAMLAVVFWRLLFGVTPP